MTGGLRGQALMREAVLSVSLTLGLQAEGQLRPAAEQQSFLMTKLSIRSARHSTGGVSATVTCGCMFPDEQICRVFWILSIVLSPTMWGRRIAGCRKSGPQGVSTQRITLRLGEADELGLTVMIVSVANWVRNKKTASRLRAAQARFPSCGGRGVWQAQGLSLLTGDADLGDDGETRAN